MPNQTKKISNVKKTRVNTRTKTATSSEADGVFFLKLVLYMILGSMWVKVMHQDSLSLPLPVGLVIGLLFAMHEHFQIDRKIEFAILLVAMLVGYFAPFGLYLAF